MITMKEFLATESIDLGGWDKFPQGDTFINITKVLVEKIESNFKDEKGNSKEQYRLTMPDGQKLICPKGTMAEIQKVAKEGFTEIRVTRTGTTKDNTHYTVVGTIK